jgi:hypothetical protein
MEIAVPPAVGTTLFCPTHREVIELILRPMIGTGRELHFDSRRYVSVADVYSAPPYDLVAQHAQPASSGHGARAWYFLSPAAASASRRARRSRAVAGTDGKGRWHTEAGRKPVQGTAGGYMSKFSYQEKTSSSGTTKPGGWLMAEYGIVGCDTVIAKIYRSPRRPATNEPLPSWTASSSSTSTWRSSFPMTDAAGDALDSVEPHSHQQGLSHYPYFANHYLAGNHNVVVAAAAAGQGAGHYLAGQDLVSAAAADVGPGQGQGAGHYFAAVCQPTVAMSVRALCS